MDRSSSVISGRFSQPSSPMSIGTMTWIALPSSDGIGPTESFWTGAIALNAVTCPATAWRSAAVTPSGCSYTMTAGASFRLWKASSSSVTRVDWAFSGSQDAASLLSAPGSWPAGPNDTARMTSQKPTTSHFVTRDAGSQASLPTSPMRVSVMGLVPFPLDQWPPGAAPSFDGRQGRGAPSPRLRGI